MGKKVLVTGAGSGFGLNASVALAARGHEVIAATETEEQAAQLRAAHPELTVEVIDITTDDVQKAAGLEVDVLINNAGAGQWGPIAEVPIERVRRIFDVNVFGTLAITQAVVPQMVKRGSGRVIIVSSIAGVTTGPTVGPYSMTKHALEAMGKAMRMELAGAGVDVTLLNPGPYNTGFNDAMAASMWEWFDDDALTAEAAPIYRFVGEAITKDQLDPAEVTEKMVELVEAETTEEHNFVPPEIMSQIPQL